MRCSSAIPAGMSTSSVRVAATRPRPRHSEHGTVGTRPSPPQVSHTWVRTSWPNAVRETARSWPAPPQRLQVSIGVPGSAALPWQRGQRSTTSYSTSTLAPLAASSRVTSTDTITSPPWAAPPAPPPNGAPPPKKASTMAANEPNPPPNDERKPGDAPNTAAERRGEAARVEPLVAVAVVGGAPLGVGEDLVRIGSLLELLLGV